MQRTIDGLSVTIVRKSIKNMHLRVLSPNGEIQITAPNRLSVSQIDRFVREKRGWIEARQQQLAARPVATDPAFVDGQTVYLWGGSYTLRLEEAARGRSALQRGQEIVLSVHPEDDTSQRESLLNDFYREALSERIAARLPLWEARTGLHPSAWQIKNMKTRWGTCNTATRKIWLNLQLVKQPPVCLDYVIAHELAHLRGVAREDEANFCAVVACMESGDEDYRYSGALLAYIYLGNALYRADYDAWREVYSTLSENVRADLRANNDYWARFETPAADVSEKVYESFLQTYGDDRGMQSYGACVDLLTVYYLDTEEGLLCAKGAVSDAD